MMDRPVNGDTCDPPNDGGEAPRKRSHEECPGASRWGTQFVRIGKHCEGEEQMQHNRKANDEDWKYAEAGHGGDGHIIF